MRQDVKVFAWRVWNTFKMTVLPIVLVMVINRLDGQVSISSLADVRFWDSVLVAVITSLAGSVLAGLDKVNRVNRDRYKITDTTDEE